MKCYNNNSIPSCKPSVSNFLWYSDNIDTSCQFCSSFTSRLPEVVISRSGTSWRTTSCWPCLPAGWRSWWRSCCSSTWLPPSLSSQTLQLSSSRKCWEYLRVVFDMYLPTQRTWIKDILIPDFNVKRCAFRSLSVLMLLFTAETVPSFGAILDLVGASTVTLLTFVFPPYFYMKLTDASSHNPEWQQRYSNWKRNQLTVDQMIGDQGPERIKGRQDFEELPVELLRHLKRILGSKVFLCLLLKVRILIHWGHLYVTFSLTLYRLTGHGLLIVVLLSY